MNASLVWFRRGPRLDDRAARHHALKSGGQTHCAGGFDTGRHAPKD